MKESDIENQILEYLTLIGARAIKIPSAGFFDGNTMRSHKSKFVQKGISDVFVWSHGKFYAFEVKTPQELKYIVKHYEKIATTGRILLNKKQQHIQDQIVFIEMIRSQGFIGEFVCSVEQVKNILK